MADELPEDQSHKLEYETTVDDAEVPQDDLDEQETLIDVEPEDEDEEPEEDDYVATAEEEDEFWDDPEAVRSTLKALGFKEWPEDYLGPPPDWWNDEPAQVEDPKKPTSG